MVEYTQPRSLFWLKIYDDEHFTLCCNKITKRITSKIFPHLEGLSPKGWNKSTKYDDMYTLWIPNSNIKYVEIDNLKAYAEAANNHIWVSLNKHTRTFFNESVLEFCVCGDWNYSFEESSRTALGEAEYQTKYKNNYTKENIDTLYSAIDSCFSCFIDAFPNYIITTIPATINKQNKLSWLLSKATAEHLESEFLAVTLTKEKPQIKEQSIENKIEIWRKIFSDSGNISLSAPVFEKNVIIIDDLYQSGASMWCYAEYLKSIGAKHIIGVCIVKARKDGDNK